MKRVQTWPYFSPTVHSELWKWIKNTQGDLETTVDRTHQNSETSLFTTFPKNIFFSDIYMCTVCVYAQTHTHLSGVKYKVIFFKWIHLLKFKHLKILSYFQVKIKEIKKKHGNWDN